MFSTQFEAISASYCFFFFGGGGGGGPVAVEPKNQQLAETTSNWAD